MITGYVYALLPHNSRSVRPIFIKFFIRCPFYSVPHVFISQYKSYRSRIDAITKQKNQSFYVMHQLPNLFNIVCVRLSLDLRTFDLPIFATTNHVNLYLFFNLRTLFSLNEEPINFLSLILYDYYT
jgi:hypothetical protein